MAYQPHLIAPFKSALVKYYKPWIIGEDAFPQISDAYTRRGVVRKREGYKLLASFPGNDKPVQGLKNWVNPSTLGEFLIAFSQTLAYAFNDISQSFVNITTLSDGTSFTFGNGPNDYFWSSNYAGSMWITNGIALNTTGTFPLPANGIFYLTSTGLQPWNIHQPQINGTPTFLNGCLIILPYKGRLVCLNTFEGPLNGSSNTNIPNRARWSQIGTPYVATGGGHVTSPPSGFTTDSNSWRDDIPGRGGYVDADTSERIVSAAIIKDTLIVFFQRSTWRLRYTGNELLPFIWERLNTQYGSESTHSHIEFDDVALAFSRFGWIGANTNEAARIDFDIPDDSFAFEGTNVNITGLNKVQGIRDFYREFAYWTYIPIGQSVSTQIYAYNYLDKCWQIFNPTTPINVFGNYRNTAGDKIWSSFNAPTDIWSNFDDPTIDTWANFGGGQNEDFPYILGGDLNGNVYLMFEFFNSPGIDAIGTSFQSNFSFSITTKRFNPYIDKGLKARLGYVDLYCSATVGGEVTLNHFVDDQQTPVVTKTVELFSRGVLNITNVSIGSPCTITTSQSHNLEVGEFVILTDIQGSVGTILNNQTFLVGTTPTTSTFTIQDQNGNNIDTTGFTYISAGFAYNADLQFGDAKYTRIYLGAIAHMHQLQFTLSSNQLKDVVKGAAQLEIQGLVLWFKPTGRIRG